jgi:hypothetical protein
MFHSVPYSIAARLAAKGRVNNRSRGATQERSVQPPTILGSNTTSLSGLRFSSQPSR